MREAICTVTSILAICAGCRSPSKPSPRPSPAPANSTQLAATTISALSTEPLAAAYAAELARVRELEYPALEREVGAELKTDPAFPYNVESAKYYGLVKHILKLTPEETGMLAKNGFVSVDHQQRYSMASAYLSIYGRDLPVLITTDSILHALHRSYDAMLMESEVDWFSPALQQHLEAVHAGLLKTQQHESSRSEVVQRALADVGVYVGVALALLDGAGGPKGEQDAAAKPTQHAQSPVVSAILAHIAALTPARIALNGSERDVDFSQFRVRGHYTKHPQLRRYFRAMMWLGRADVGFTLADAPPVRQSDTQRELRAGAALTLLLEQHKQLDELHAMSSLIDFLVGAVDDVRVRDLAQARAKAGIRTFEDLEDGSKLSAFASAAAALRATGVSSIRSQTLLGSANGTAIPLTLQLLGQRFTLDGFLLSKLVFDSISYRGQRPKRMLPSGLDVMAALGNNTALQLQKPAIEQYHYTANLLAARRVVEQQPTQFWRSSVYSLWLDALRTLSASAPKPEALPHVMQRGPWRKKQLTTQLASWAELRHDTILYAKQSYSAVPGCGYPDGYVEPYPEFFERMELLGTEAARYLQALNTKSQDGKTIWSMERVQLLHSRFFGRFAEHMATLRRLAEKELSSEPFTQAESDFIKQTIDRTKVGSGMGVLRYTGWYAQLIYPGSPAKWEPTVADVHTADGLVLEEAVGDANLLIVAVDNQKDRAIYVGPVYSHYEFTRPAEQRMQDEEFAKLIEQNRTPERPGWTLEYVARPHQRTMADVVKKPRAPRQELEGLRRNHRKQ